MSKRARLHDRGPLALRRLLFDPLLLVCQMPKTGSQTVEATLRNTTLPHQIFRTHFLSAQVSAATRALLRSHAQDSEWRRNTEMQLANRDRLWRVVRGRQFLRRCGVPLPKIDVIAAVREPVGQALSDMFENWAHVLGGMDGASVAFCRQELLKPRDPSFIWQWFERELKEVLGIDVFRAPFPCGKGYAVYEGRFARALVYRFEKLSLLPAMLREFLGREIRSIVSRNIGRQKRYGEVYQEVRQQLRLPPEFVRAHCHCAMMRHFYTDEERLAFELRWSEARLTTAAAG